MEHSDNMLATILVSHISENALHCRKAPDKSGPAHPTSAWERIAIFEVFLEENGGKWTE